MVYIYITYICIYVIDMSRYIYMYIHAIDVTLYIYVMEMSRYIHGIYISITYICIYVIDINHLIYMVRITAHIVSHVGSQMRTVTLYKELRGP